jgi:flagellar hook-length control protein FliK
LNVFQITISAMSGNMPAEDISQIPSSINEDDFKTVLGDIMGQTAISNSGLADSETGTIEDSESLKLKLMALLDSGMGLTGPFEKNIVSLAAMLLGGSKSPEDQKSLLNMLNTILKQIGNIAGPGSNLQSGLLMQLQVPEAKASLLGELQNALSGLPESLKAKLQNALANLPEPLKAKLQAMENGYVNDPLSSDEVSAIQTALLPVLAAAMEPEASAESSAALQNTSDLLKGRATKSVFEAFAEEAMGGNNIFENDRQQIAKETEDTAIPKTSSVMGQAVGPENTLADNDDVAGRRPEKTGPQVAELLSNEDMTDLARQGKVADDAKINSDASESEKVRTSTAAPMQTATEGGLPDDTSSAGTKNPQGNDRTVELSDAPRSTSQGTGQAQTAFSQTIETAGPQGIATQPESVARTVYSEQGFIETDKLLSRIVGKLDILLSGGRSEAKIKLIPESLGELKIHLVMDGGSMKAVLNASTPQAKELLEANLGALKQSLENQGLQLNEFEVSVNQQQSNRDHSPYKHRHFGRGFGNGEGSDLVMENDRARAKAYAILNGSMAVNYLA